MGATLLLLALVAVRGGTLIDGDRVVADAVVVIRGDRIESSAADVEIPSGARIVEAAGGFIVPGFIDNHVHVGRTGISPEWARNGVTTLIDNGSSVPTPGVPSCGRIITAIGGYPAVGTTESSALEMTSIGEVEWYLDHMRPDCVKIAIERGFLADYDDAGWPVLTPEEVRAIVEAAHTRKLVVRAHVTQPGELAVAIDAGVDVIAHTPIAPIPAELLRKAAEKKVIFVSTAALWNDERLSRIVAENLWRYSFLSRGRIAIGSDYPNWPQPGIHAELRLLANAVPRVAPGRLLNALTRDGAAALGRTDIGTLAPGARGDVVVLATDPRNSAQALEQVRAVIRGGIVVRDDPPIELLQAWVGTWMIHSSEQSSSGPGYREKGRRVCAWTGDRTAIRCEDQTEITWSCGYPALPRKSTAVSTMSFNDVTGSFELTTEADGAAVVIPFTYNAEYRAMIWPGWRLELSEPMWVVRPLTKQDGIVYERQYQRERP